MFRFILINARKPFTFSKSFGTKVSIRRYSRENNYGIIGQLNDSSVFLLGTKQIILNTNRLTPIAHHYATKATAIKSDQSNSLGDFIKQLNDCVSSGNHLTYKDIRQLSQLLKTQRANDDQALDILRLCSFGCIDRNISEQFKSIWNELKDYCQFNTEHFNYRLRFTSQKEDVMQTQEIFDELIADGHQPDVVSYQCLLFVYCNSGNMEKTHEILDKMRQNNIIVNECSSNYLIQCYINCGNIDTAYKEIENLNKNGFKLNRDTLMALLSHYAKTGDRENVEKTIEMFNEPNNLSNHIELLNYDILKIGCESAVNGHANLIESLFQHLKKNAELNIAIRNAISLFVLNKQSAILPRIFQMITETDPDTDTDTDTDIKQMYTHLINEMVKHCTTETEFNTTIKLIEANGLPLDKNFELFRPALKSSSEEMIRKLLQHMKLHRIDVTDNEFIKLFQLASEKGVENVINVLNLMFTEFRIQLRPTYFRDVILPAMNANNEPKLALEYIKKTKIPIRIAVIAVINSSLSRCDFITAIDVMKNHNLFYVNNAITAPLLKAYANTGDVQHFIEIVKIIVMSFSQIHNYYVDTVLTADEIRAKGQAFIGNMLYNSIKHTLNDSDKLIKLLETFITEKLRTNANVIMKIQNELLRVSVQSTVGSLLKMLTTEKVQFDKMHFKKDSDQNEETSAELEIMLHEQRDKHLYGLEKRLFIAYIREGNISKVETMMAKCDLRITQANYAKLIELYAGIGNLEMAMKLLQEVSLKYHTFKLDPPKTAQILTLMYENNWHINEIETFLHAQRPQQNHDRMIPFEMFLQRVATNGNVHLLDQLFDTLVKFNYIKATVETLGPLISVRLNSDAYSDAVDKFEIFAKTYKILPMSMILFIELIRNDKLDLLERAHKVYVMVYGESDGASRLAFAYNDCGYDQKAKLIFQSGRINNLTKSIGQRCKTYFANDDIESAKLLLKSTKETSCDRRIIYQTILDICCKANMIDDALDLWDEFSHEGILPPYNFIDKFKELLKVNNVKFPKNLLLNCK